MMLSGSPVSRKTVESLRSAGIFVSLFIDPSEEQLVASQKIHADMIEIHTGTYSDAGIQRKDKKEEELKYQICHRELKSRRNAGHGLHYHNVKEVAAIRKLMS